jgi:phosphoserine aminotransferase
MTVQVHRIFNFSAGPAVLPEAVLEEAQRDLMALPGVGMSVMEISHRSTTFDEILQGAEADMRALGGIPGHYRVLFLQGGASLQFSMVPMNLLTPGAAYVHMTSNNTIFGTQFHEVPQVDAPLVCDTSSDMYSRPIDVSKFGLIYAGAQKNLGPSGVTVVIVREDLLSRSADQLPSMLNLKLLAENHSLYNTPPVFGIYILRLVLKWMRSQGGLEAIGRVNERKARLLYDELDRSEFWRPHAEPESRSRMNITFRLPGEELEKKFVKEGTAAGFDGLKGHRSVGGLRASIYNAFPEAGVAALVEFMREFERRNG